MRRSEEDPMEMERFMEKLASSTATPGGGSASAFAGALSASLVAMVAGLSLKKGKVERPMGAIKKKALAIQKRLLRAVDEDARSFEQVLQAYRLPRDTEKDQQRRMRAIQKAYQKATVTPQLVCQQSLQLINDSKFLIEKGNPNAVSDAGVAAFLADAAMAGGLLNIGINLMPIKDKAFVKKMRRQMEDWVKERNRVMEKILTFLLKIG